MTVVDIGSDTEERLQTTVCGLCGAKHGVEYKQLSTHLAKNHTIDDLELDPSPADSGRPEIRCDGGSVQDDEYSLGDVSTEDLQIEFQELSQLAYDSLGDHDAVDHGRMRAIWEELEDRLDADYPECPECGAEEWVQSPGEPKWCHDCGRAVAEDEDDIRRAIDDEWTRVGLTGVDSA